MPVLIPIGVHLAICLPLASTVKATWPRVMSIGLLMGMLYFPAINFLNYLKSYANQMFHIECLGRDLS